ncbi:MAG: acetyltransferase [Myxococcaceae bacterium]|nr:acetyltransferase [Myxococcaceae bacterium]
MLRDSRAFEIVPDPQVQDEQLLHLLDLVYVQGGHTPPALAETLFAPARVRARGRMLAAHDADSQALVGMIIVVPPGGAARQIARGGEAELHLLAVDPDARGQGIGAALIRAALKFARSEGWTQIVLSTQKQMTSAQTLYANAGFKRAPERDWVRGEASFLVYEI